MSSRQELLIGIAEDLGRLKAKVEELAKLEDAGVGNGPAANKGGVGPPEQEVSVTYDDARVAFYRKFGEGKKEEVMKLVAPYGVKQLTDIPLEELPKLLKEVEAL